MRVDAFMLLAAAGAALAPPHASRRRGVALRAGWEVPPANQGIGFQVRGTGVFHHLFGQLSSPETFGNYGAGSTMFMVDPEADLSFSFLSAGVMTQAANIERMGKLSDLALSACL